MTISIELNEDQADRFQEAARRLGVKPDELARAAIADLLGRPSDDFQQAAEHVLRKNDELYRRLS